MSGSTPLVMVQEGQVWFSGKQGNCQLNPKGNPDGTPMFTAFGAFKVVPPYPSDSSWSELLWTLRNKHLF